MRRPTAGGGWQAIRYTLVKARAVGPLKLWRAMRSKNACKTCAVGMGGQLGGMVNEERQFPEFCKKSLQAMAADMQGRIEPKFFETYSIEQLQAMSPRELERCGRLADPLIAGPGDTHYRVSSWDEALSRAADALKKAPPERTFFYASGRSSNEAGFILQLLGRAHGTNHVTNCSFYCHSASGVGLGNAFGTGTATCELEDLDRCDFILLLGANPASNHPRLMTKLVELRRRGGKVIVVNPLREVALERFKVPSRMRSLFFGSDVASTYVQPVIGGDLAFLVGVSKAVLEYGRLDEKFMAEHTEGSEPVLAYLQAISWAEIESASGVAKSVVYEVARDYIDCDKAMFAWTMGITHHIHGVQNVHWIANLALLRGMVGKPGAGLLPIRGHSNVQGIGTVGVTPWIKKSVLERLESCGIEAPKFRGYDTLESLEAADRGDVNFGLCLGGNLYGASPDATFTAQALSKVDTLTYLSTSLNTGHAHGLGQTTIILPVLARDEEPQSTTQESMFNYVRLSDGGPHRFEGPRSEVDVLTSLGAIAVGPKGPLDWENLKGYDQIRGLIADLVPGLEPIRNIGETKREFEIENRVFHQPVFNTTSGRARFHADLIPVAEPLGENQLRLTTIRSEGQFNTVVYEEEDLYRGQERRNVILMSEADISRLDLCAGMVVNVSSEVGTMRGIIVQPFDISPTCAAMYYPEANVLVPRTADPGSRTPAYKSVVITLERS